MQAFQPLTNFTPIYFSLLHSSLCLFLLPHSPVTPPLSLSLSLSLFEMKHFSEPVVRLGYFQRAGKVQQKQQLNSVMLPNICSEADARPDPKPSVWDMRVPGTDRH